MCTVYATGGGWRQVCAFVFLGAADTSAMTFPAVSVDSDPDVSCALHRTLALDDCDCIGRRGLLSSGYFRPRGLDAHVTGQCQGWARLHWTLAV